MQISGRYTQANKQADNQKRAQPHWDTISRVLCSVETKGPMKATNNFVVADNAITTTVYSVL